MTLSRAVATLLRPLLSRAWPPGEVRRVVAGPRRGLRFVVAPGLGAGFALGLQPHLHDRAFPPLVRPGGVVWDIGANRGQMTLLFARLVGDRGQVVALEPVPALYGGLCRNIELNRLAQVTARCAAAAEASGHRPFLYDPACSLEGRLADHDPGRTSATLEVETVTLDELLATGAPVPDLVKIDVEGGAALVLAGAERLLREVTPTIYLELHGPVERAAVRERVMTAGYTVATLVGEPVADPTRPGLGPLLCRRDAGRAGV